MSEIQLKDPAAFGTQLLSLYMEQGFQSMSKRELELLIFILLERDGAIQHSATNYDVARMLRLTPARVKTLRRDAYARWRPLIGGDRVGSLRRILEEVLTYDNIEAGAKHASEKNRSEGFLAIRVEHADDKEELEQAINEAGAIPIYERNRDVLVVRFDTLLTIAERFGFIGKDPSKVLKALKQVAPTSDQVTDLLKTDVKDLKWADVRAAFNSVGASVVTGLLETKVTDLLKIAFPFLG